MNRQQKHHVGIVTSGKSKNGAVTMDDATRVEMSAPPNKFTVTHVCDLARAFSSAVSYLTYYIYIQGPLTKVI